MLHRTASRISAPSRPAERALGPGIACRAKLSRRTVLGVPLLTVPMTLCMGTKAGAADLTIELDKRGRERVKYEKSGWSFWQWRDHKVHYVTAGTQGPPVLLIHGYGASAYHWRYQIPVLAKTHRVYAMDLLGFGWSEKALVEYGSGRLWASQIADFVREIVHGDASAAPGGEEEGSSSSSKQPVVLVGNSLGGYACMNAAAQCPELVRAVALLNSAGPFEDPDQPLTEGTAAEAQQPWYAAAREAVMAAGKRVVLWFAFQRAKQPESIRSVLQMVYTTDESIDEDLVDSIVVPATDPAAAEVFYRINANKGPQVTVNQLLAQMRAAHLPLLLLWGDRDPWITPSRADRIQTLYPEADRVGLQSGHCPHDDTPDECNAALLDWLTKLETKKQGLPSSSSSSSSGASARVR